MRLTLRQLAGVAACALSLGLAGCGSGTPSDSAVAGDLGSLLLNKANEAVTTNEITCAHQNGDQYVCVVNRPGASQQTFDVTDDGKTIYEQPEY